MQRESDGYGAMDSVRKLRRTVSVKRILAVYSGEGSSTESSRAFLIASFSARNNALSSSFRFPDCEPNVLPLFVPPT